MAASVTHLTLHIRQVSSQRRPGQVKVTVYRYSHLLFSELHIEGGESVAVVRYHFGRVTKPEANIAPSQRRRRSGACPSHAPSPHTSASPHRPVLLLTLVADDCMGNAFTLSTSFIIIHFKSFTFDVFLSQVEAMC